MEPEVKHQNSNPYALFEKILLVTLNQVPNLLQDLTISGSLA